LKKLKDLIEESKKLDERFRYYLPAKAIEEGMDSDFFHTSTSELTSGIIKVYVENNESSFIKRKDKDNGENAYKVRFPLSQYENYTFLIDVNFDKMLKNIKEKPVSLTEKDGISLDVELWHRGVIYYSETDIDTNNFNPELLTVTQQYGEDGEIEVSFYYNNEFLNLYEEDCESEGEGSDCSLTVLGKVQKKDVESLLPDDHYIIY
jgi:hypothetical protein